MGRLLKDEKGDFRIGGAIGIYSKDFGYEIGVFDGSWECEWEWFYRREKVGEIGRAHV